MSKTKHPKEVVCSIDQQQLIPKDAVKCLGFCWSWNLAAKVAVDEAVMKARCAFFLYGGMGAFQGDLNPLSGRAIFETCVIPTLLYFCENWILTENMLMTLESFQAEIGRRILKFSRFHQALAVCVLLQWPSVKARVLMRKLIFPEMTSAHMCSELLWQVISAGSNLSRSAGTWRKLDNKLHIQGCTTSQ